MWSEIDDYLGRNNTSARISRFYSDIDNLVIEADRDEKNLVREVIEALGWKFYDIGTNEDKIMITFK
ncbi:MAG: hypothetical protein J6S67_14370 [Methanobrevibacter sp.]|nr:hypothetical protein [Methanobrevibacter sp.]